MSVAIRVLHVEDDADFAELTAEFLERETDSLAVETVVDPREGLDRALGDDVDCVVSDFDMPALDGIELLERIRARDPHLPFILFTGKGSEEVASEALSKDATDYLQKDVGTDQWAILANRVENAVAQQRSVTERQRAERRFEAVFEDPNLLVGLLDTDGTMLDCNETASALVEPDRETLRGQPFWETPWWSESAREDVREWVERAAAGEYVSYQAGHERPDGDTIVVRGSIRPVTDDGGDVTSLVASAHDVSESAHRDAEVSLN